MYFDLAQNISLLNGQTRPKARFKRIRKGAAAVEMALVSPVLFAILLGTIEFGRAIMVVNMLTATAREGVRIAVMPGGSNSDVTATVNSNLSSMGIAFANATTTVQVNGVVADASTANSGDNVAIKISVPYSKVTWLPSTIFMGNTSALNGMAVMRRE